MIIKQMAEVRSWRRNKDGTITGYVHKCPNQVWEEGEFAALGPFEVELESASFFVFKQGLLSFKAMKDEEKKGD